MQVCPSHDTHERASIFDKLDLSNGVSEPALVALARCAALLADCPAARISFFDGDRQWLKADVGFDVEETSSGSFLCRRALRCMAPLLVADLRRDPRFTRELLSAGVSHLRFYAGFPIRLDGLHMGVLCVLDTQVRHLRPERIEALGALAHGVELWLTARRESLLAAECQDRLHDFLMLSREQVWECDSELRVTWRSPGGPDMLAPGCSAACRLFDAEAPIRDLDGCPSADGETLGSVLHRRERFSQRVVRCQRHVPARFIELAGTPQWSSDGSFLGYRGLLSDRTDWIQLRHACAERID